MKKQFITLVAAALFSTSLVPWNPAHGAAAEDGSAPEKVAGLPKAAATPAATTGKDELKTLPMNSRADVIDVKGRFFITKRKDGVEVKNVLTETTDIKQGPAPALFEDIKTGDYVSGSRRKVSDTEYTVVKITKFGPRVSKKDSAKKADATKAN